MGGILAARFVASSKASFARPCGGQDADSCRAEVPLSL